MIVDDNPDIRGMLVELLQLLGYFVEEAGDGPQGPMRIMSSRPEIALVDIGLPGFDGYELARRARQAIGREVRLVAMTGYGQAEDRTRAQEAGFDAHLTKPVSVEAMRRLSTTSPPGHTSSTEVVPEAQRQLGRAAGAAAVISGGWRRDPTRAQASRAA